MNYNEAREYLAGIAKAGNLLGLEPMKQLLMELGNPQDQLRFIHIAGTNGKGSVLAYVSTILKEAGFKVGRYISPTLFSYREKIQVNEEEISREALARLTERVRNAIGRMAEKNLASPTIFEVETAIAFLYFVEMDCDLVVLETGMGGDTDATNVIKTTILEILVSISMDHMEFLGDTLAEIAGHKAGIIKPKTRVVSALQEEEAMSVIRTRAREMEASLTVADWREACEIHYGVEEQMFSYGGYRDLLIHLGGSYQIKNAVVAVECVEALRRSGFSITERQMRDGLSKTVWKGRFTVLCHDPLVMIDGAHNPDGARELRSSIENCLSGKKIYGICGVFKDKEYTKVLELVAPCLGGMVTVQTPDNPRALPARELAEVAANYIQDVQPCESIGEAVEISMEKARKNNGMVLAFGSLSFLGEIRKTVEKKG